MTHHKLFTTDALADGEALTVEVDGRQFACARVGDEYFAIDDTCTHAKVSLGDGIVDVDDCTLECPKHGALFSLRSGEALTLPASHGVQTHPIEVVENEVFVTIDGDAS